MVNWELVVDQEERDAADLFLSPPIGSFIGFGVVSGVIFIGFSLYAIPKLVFYWHIRKYLQVTLACWRGAPLTDSEMGYMPFDNFVDEVIKDQKLYKGQQPLTRLRKSLSFSTSHL